MILVQTLDELERDVAIAEMQAVTIGAAFRVDEAIVSSTERLAARIGRSLEEHRPSMRSYAVARPFALKVRVGAALDRMHAVERQRKPLRAA